jgi:hypothetical protein
MNVAYSVRGVYFPPGVKDSNGLSCEESSAVPGAVLDSARDIREHRAANIGNIREYSRSSRWKTV